MLLKRSIHIAVLATLLPFVSVFAQEQSQLPFTLGKAKHEAPGRHWCATPGHMSSPEGQAAIKRFQEARRNGTLPRVSKSQEVLEVGAMQSFNVILDSLWEQATFELRATGTRFNIWVRTDASDQLPVTDERIEQMRMALETATPEGSLDPAMGVFELDEMVFGSAPVYPNGSDGVVDILIYELAPGVAGFVSPRDIDPNAPDGEGNQGEVLHLWVDGLYSTSDSQIESVAAHEYQHLIHLNYDPAEIQFVNEGLSEYAQLMVGYTAVVPWHLLLEPQPEYNISLFSWRNGEDAVILDYTRGSTWHGYLGDQLGSELTGSFTRHPQIGLEGYKAVLADAGADITIDDLILDFYTALIVNDTTIDTRFGIFDPVRAAQIDLILPRNRRFGESLSTEGNIDTMIVQPGGTEYVEWRNVKNLEFTFDVKAGPDLIEARRAHARLRVITEPVEGPMQFLDFAPSDQMRLIEGSFKKVTLVAANVRPEVAPLPAFLKSSWSSDPDIVSYAYGIDTPRIDPISGALLFAMSEGSEGRYAVRFPVPPGAALNDVEMGVFHLSQFNGAALNEPRDYLLTVWGNGGGVPGEILFSEVVANTNPTQLIQVAAYDWQTFEFDPLLSKNVALGDTIYVGAREVGADPNYMVVWPAQVNFGAFPNGPPVDTGVIGVSNSNGDPGWLPSWLTTFVGGAEGDRPLRNTALAVRARFLVPPEPVAIESISELPSSISLEQNFPNPFNPTTNIRFAIPNAVNVELVVYDMTGREVATLADQEFVAGTYNVAVDAANWASGMYIYRLRAGDQQVVKRMTLLK